jgi:hypothetical protein
MFREGVRMLKQEKNQRIISLILNILIVILEIIAFNLSLGRNGWSMFLFYTEDSNYFAAIACFLMAIYQYKSLKVKHGVIPNGVKILKYMAVCLLSVTFMVVIFILSPMYGGIKGYQMMLFNGSMLYQHLICPILAFISFIYFEKGLHLNKRVAIKALIPTFTYAIILIILNVLKVTTGPYPFLMVYKQTIYLSFFWIILIMGGSFGFAYLIWYLNNK